ncbi:MAG TPA: class I tRNA ligase family protein, partial [Planctomicrobium sp.]|nr:class I tRNA ligase family protein [Planctomicrobium sp.]
HLQTAVADDEVFDEDIAGHFWTFNYPVVDASGNPTGESIRFSTTRPETMLGDTAVCVNPTDERYTSLIGKKVRIPVNGRLIPIVADGLLADKDLGTGAVKVTPAHDPNDYACYARKLGQPDEIEIINILNSDGTLNEHGGEWQGQDRLAVRPQIVERMEQLGHFEAVEDRTIPLKHSDRSKTPVEPYLSDQWFIRMGAFTNSEGKSFDLAQSSMDAVESGKVRFYPSRYAKTYLDWLAEKRDWCISRQLWWGHRIPVWTRTYETELEARETLETLMHPRDFAIAKLSQENPKTVLLCIDDHCDDGDLRFKEELEQRGFVQDPDVLDTWFSSALWPHATLGWPDTEQNPPLDETEVAKQTKVSPNSYPLTPNSSSSNSNEVLNTFYPGSVLITSRDIITLWVARMVLTGLYNMGDVPFHHVHVHPKILDGFGQTMSKSKGNGVDPVDLINKYGTDAVRFTIASFAGETQDVKLPISYECPACETLVPQTLKHQSAKPDAGVKPTIRCQKCKKEFQYTSPNYDPDAGVPVARMVSERFEYGRNFSNKLWNAARFAMLNLEGYTAREVTADQLQLEDRWILSRLSTTTKVINESLGRYQFDAATRAIRDFTWNEFCDWYLEMVKPRLKNEETRPVAQRVLLTVLDSLVRLLQPFTPFICEELWQRLKEIAPVRSLPVEQYGDVVLVPAPTSNAAIIAEWPTIPAAWQDPALEKRFERLQETIAAVRNVRAIYNIPPGSPVKLLMKASPEVAGDMQSVSAQFDNLAKAVLEAAGADVQRPSGSASFTLGDADGFIPLEGLIDTEAELARQTKEADKLRKHIASSEARLSNESFLAKAPENIVAQMQETLDGLKKQLSSIEEIIKDLS